MVESVFPRFQDKDWWWVGTPPERVRVLEERRYDLESRRMNNTWTFLTDHECRSASSSIRIYSYADLCDALRSAGFDDFRGLETGSPKPFELGASRLSLIATRR